MNTIIKGLAFLLGMVAVWFHAIGYTLMKASKNLERKIRGVEIECKKCGKKYKVLKEEIYEDEYEEPYGGISTYLLTKCPHCKEQFEPESEIYNFYYGK